MLLSVLGISFTDSGLDLSFSMMLSVGHPRNIIQMKDNPLEARNKAQRLLVKMKALLLSLDLCGMRDQAIIMMLLPVSTMIQIQVCQLWHSVFD